jgi:hypothetical protein
MATPETPLQAVKRLYGTKDKLVDGLVDTLRAAEEEAAEYKDRLLKVSNQKLLRLAGVAKEVRERYGSKDKLAEAVASGVGKAKDSDYLAKIKTFSAARLLDMMSAAGKHVAK